MRSRAIFRRGATDPPPATEETTPLATLIEEMIDAGVLFATEGCLPSARVERIPHPTEKLALTDGRFTESKELIAGFALIQAMEEAIAWTLRFLEVIGDGESEVRRLFEAQDVWPKLRLAGAEPEESPRAQVSAPQ